MNCSHCHELIDVFPDPEKKSPGCSVNDSEGNYTGYCSRGYYHYQNNFYCCPCWFNTGIGRQIALMAYGFRTLQ